MRVERPDPSPPEPIRDFLAELLAEQRRLDTPIARFSAAHDSGAQLSALRSQLIPLTTPGPGEQYAFEVDLDACSGCKACVVACHALNGLEETESWRDVGLVHGGNHRHPFQQTVTTACHHCADPGCLNGCPVLAYEKDPVTGIVRHLDDQCIGCQYCILKCPYDVPKYSERLGIVRKCDLCHQRLADGEAPACAQACPTAAIKIVKVTLNVAPLATTRVDTSRFLPGAPDPRYTQPTTRYLTRRQLPENLVAADATALRLQPPHWPLVALLVLLPMAIGCGLADQALHRRSAALAVMGWVAGALGLALAGLHLGQPLRDGEADETAAPGQIARRLAGPLRNASELRVIAALVGGILVPLGIALGAMPVAFAWAGLPAALGGEVAERYLFFRAVDAPKMPGSVKP